MTAAPELKPVRAADFICEVLKLAGTPYLWGGKGTHGIDCSGVVTYAYLRAGGTDLRLFHNTDKLWAELEPVSSFEALKPGGLVFYQGHVMVHLACGVVFGACNGDRSTTSLTRAHQQGAFVTVKPSYTYRKDLRGFRKLPLSYEEAPHHGA